MTEDEIFEVWAPRDGRWSPWVKPVLFSFVNAVLPGEELSAFPGLEPLQPAPEIALVLDLPGVDSVAAGLTLASRGWRPIPLFNALPSANPDAFSPDSALIDHQKTITQPPVAVDVRPIVTALRIATPMLASLPLPSLAPPAFLLDSRRHGLDWKAVSHTFNNRSISFPSDFPSAGKLREFGISRAVLIQQAATPQDDLMHTLRQWRQDGISIELLVPGSESQLRPCPIRRVTKLGLWWMKLTTFLTLKRAGHGAYGGIYIEPSAG